MRNLKNAKLKKQPFEELLLFRKQSEYPLSVFALVHCQVAVILVGAGVLKKDLYFKSCLRRCGANHHNGYKLPKSFLWRGLICLESALFQVTASWKIEVRQNSFWQKRKTADIFAAHSAPEHVWPQRDSAFLKTSTAAVRLRLAHACRRAAVNLPRNVKRKVKIFYLSTASDAHDSQLQPRDHNTDPSNCSLEHYTDPRKRAPGEYTDRTQMAVAAFGLNFIETFSAALLSQRSR